MSNAWNGAGRRIELCDVGMRDGLQMECQFVPTEDKIALVNALSAAGQQMVMNAIDNAQWSTVAELREVVQALGEALEVARPVAVPVHERLDVQAVDHRVLPPQVARLGDPHAAPPVSWGRTRAPKASMKASCCWPTWCR